jgi:hypothetical protein
MESTGPLTDEQILGLAEKHGVDLKNNILGFAREILTHGQKLALEKVVPESLERPNRLIEGDIWEFEAELKVKGKRKLQNLTLQWEVVGWHQGQHAWQLRSLDGRYIEYLLEFSPQYEAMDYVGKVPKNE